MIHLDKSRQESLYMQLYSQIKQEILDGTLKEGDILAGSRALANTLCVSRNTVYNAYSQLVAEGYITAVRGIGYRVQKLPELPKLHTPRSFASISPIPKPKNITPAVTYDLTNSSHTSDLFPKTLWKKYTLECLERLSLESKLSLHLDKQGELYLRHHLRLYLERIRGVHCNEKQIIITSGLQQSLDFICKILCEKQSVILMEEPGYNKAAAVFQNSGLKIQTAPVDENGLIVHNLPVSKDIKALYCTPSHQFPTGAVLPIGRRYELLSWAKQCNAYIIEDDFDSELQYYAKPIPSVQSIDTQDCVIYLGTFSKGLSPSIRMGYMILPPKLLEIYYEKFEHYNSTVPLLNQYVIGRLIESGQYDRHVRRLNHIFRKRYECFSKELSDVAGKIKISGNGRGQYFLLEFSEQVDQATLIDAALQQGVRVYPTMQFWQEKADCPPNTLFLGFCKIDLENIADCVARLKKAWAQWIF